MVLGAVLVGSMHHGLRPGLLCPANRFRQRSLARITPPGHGGSRSSVQLFVAEKPVLPGHDATSQAGSQDEHPGLPGIASKCPDNWPPCGHGLQERSSLQGVWLGQARAAVRCQPRGAQGTSHPGSQMFLGQSEETEAPGCSLPSLLPLCPPQPESTVPGLSASGPLHCPSGPGHCGLQWTSALPQPHSQDIRGPLERSVRRAGTRERPCCTASLPSGRASLA